MRVCKTDQFARVATSGARFFAAAIASQDTDFIFDRNGYSQPREQGGLLGEGLRVCLVRASFAHSQFDPRQFPTVRFPPLSAVSCRKSALHASDDCTEHDNFVRIKIRHCNRHILKRW